jgi:hypothetical protein
MTLMQPRQAAGTSGLSSDSVVARSAQDAVVASGLAPVFGLMRNVNLAYGLNLLGVMKRLLGMKMASSRARPDGKEQPSDRGGCEGPNENPSLKAGAGCSIVLMPSFAGAADSSSALCGICRLS